MALPALAHHVPPTKSVQSPSGSRGQASPAAEGVPRGFFCYPLWQEGSLKLHRLQSVWTARRLPEGGHTGESNDSNQTDPSSKKGNLFDTTYCQDPYLNSQIENLHTLARQGGCPWIQPYIDAYLPSVAYLQQNPLTPTHQSRKMILSPTDSPQLGTLPDITFILRAMLLQTDLEKYGYILSPLYSSLPCIKRPTTRKPLPIPDQDTHQVAIRILLALLLGIYPTSVKFPPFRIRVNLYRRIHCLLTNGQGIQFCKAHPSLLTLALMEYLAFVIPTYLPVEYKVLAEEHGVQNFFSSCPLSCDAFRQEALVTGEESWEALEAYCIPIVERHSKACKSRQRTRPPDQFPAVKLSSSDNHKIHNPGHPTNASGVSSFPFIVPYAIHTDDPTDCIMASEMAFLGLQNTGSSQGRTEKPDSGTKISPKLPAAQAKHSRKSSSKPYDTSHEQAVILQRTVYTHQLPPNLTKLQLSAMSARMKVCERSALSGSVLYVCISCVMANQQTICRKGRAFPTRGQCKFDLDSDGLLCSVCQSHSIIAISTLGRIVSLRNYRFYLAPCCCTVQIYTGRGCEFQPIKLDPLSESKMSNSVNPEFKLQCPHKLSRPSTKTAKRRCELCSNIAVPDPHTSVDHLTGEQHHTYLCQRHTPHSDVLKQVTNWRQLQDEIRKRDRPLFATRHPGRKGVVGLNK